MKCANWMNYEAIRETVKEYSKRWGPPPDEVPMDNLSDFNITRNCMECNMRPQMPQSVETLCQIAALFKDSTLLALEKVGMKRKCYKPDSVEQEKLEL